MYINDLPAIAKHCSIQLYADDTLLYFSSKCVDTIETKLSEDLEQIISWFLLLSLLSVSKLQKV